MLDKNTALTFEGSYQDQRRQLDTGLIFYNGAIQGPINRSFNEPTDFQRVDDYKAALNLIHKFDDDWTGRIGFFADSYNYTTFGTMPDVGSTAAYNGFAPGFGLPTLSPTEILRETESTHLSEQFYDLRAELNGKFNGIFFKNNGWSVPKSPGTTRITMGCNPTPLLGASHTLLSTMPIRCMARSATRSCSPEDLSHIAQERYGFYLSDMIEFTEHLKMLVAVRYDIVNTNFTNTYNSNYFGSTAGSFPLTVNNSVDYYLSPRASAWSISRFRKCSPFTPPTANRSIRR